MAANLVTFCCNTDLSEELTAYPLKPADSAGILHASSLSLFGTSQSPLLLFFSLYFSSWQIDLWAACAWKCNGDAPAISAVAPGCCHAARLWEKKVGRFLREMGLKSKMARNVMWNNDVVAGNWCEADGRLFRETLAPLNKIHSTVAAAMATTGIRELPAQANERALSRWDRETPQGPRG